MKKKTISEIAIKYLKDNDLPHIGYGWFTQLHDIYDEWREQYPNKKNSPHPRVIFTTVLNALDRDSNNWEKKYFRADRGLARYFILKI